MGYTVLTQNDDLDHHNVTDPGPSSSSPSGLHHRALASTAAPFTPLWPSNAKNSPRTVDEEQDNTSSHQQQHHQHHQHISFTPSPSLSRSLSPTSSSPTNHSPLNQLVHSITSPHSVFTASSYDLLESDDFAADAPHSPVRETGKGQADKHSKLSSPSSPTSPPYQTSVPLHIPQLQHRPSPPVTTILDRNPSVRSTRSIHSLHSKSHKPILRTASGRNLALRHPTPDLQVLQGAYCGNIDHLERAAEQLSMTSSADDAIRERLDEQQHSNGHQSSLLDFQGMGSSSRRASDPSSDVQINSAAQSIGISPVGAMMPLTGSFTADSGRERSTSKSSKFGSRPEPELEGRPLDSFTTNPKSPTLSKTASISHSSPVMPRADMITEHDEDLANLTRPVTDLMDSPAIDLQLKMPESNNVDQNIPFDERQMPMSTATFDQTGVAFEGFDGTHGEPAVQTDQRRNVSWGESNRSDNTQQRSSSVQRMSMARPQSYADPDTGQQMVYYPAPVPMMLNLPQRLSKNPSSMVKNKRRTQALSSIPLAARQSAIWLPDVLENEDAPIDEDDSAQTQEYLAQHQRTTMGGRRNTQDISHMPPQLRASAFFDLPGHNGIVELKEQSAVATLDSILDASASAPVSAFTDHAYAGALGAEVYGREKIRSSKSNPQLLQAQLPKKRISTFDMLRGKRASSSELLDYEMNQQRASTSGIGQDGKIRHPIEDDEDEDGAGDGTRSTPLAYSDAGDHSRDISGDYGLGADDDEEEGNDQMYHGPPTTLLAELQLRKQHQKHRTRHLTSAFPNGVHSTLLEMDAVAQVEQKTRKQRRVNLAWEDPALQAPDENVEDDDVPLGLLYTKKSQDLNRPMGLMERRDMEDNEPLSRRRDRLNGRSPGAGRASTMMNLSSPAPGPEEENETLGQRVRRLREVGRTSTGLPAARPVSGDFASEMMSQFGGDLLNKAAPPEEQETLGQRRKRLQAEREGREREIGRAGDDGGTLPVFKTRRSMANILQAHPAAGSDRIASHQKPPSGLLGLHEQNMSQRASTMHDLNTRDVSGQRANSGGYKAGQYNDGQGGIIPPQQPQMHTPYFQQPNGNYNMYGDQAVPQFAQPTLAGFNNGMGGFGSFGNPQMMMQFPMNMNMNMNMNMGYMNGMQSPMGTMPMLNMGPPQPASQGQIDRVERWRQSVMQ